MRRPTQIHTSAVDETCAADQLDRVTELLQREHAIVFDTICKLRNTSNKLRDHTNRRKVPRVPPR